MSKLIGAEIVLIYELTAAERARMTRPVRGRGGFQNLLRKLKSQLHRRTLRVYQQDAERMKKYARYNKSAGGFQRRLLGKHPSA